MISYETLRKLKGFFNIEYLERFRGDALIISASIVASFFIRLLQIIEQQAALIAKQALYIEKQTLLIERNASCIPGYSQFKQMVIKSSEYSSSENMEKAAESIGEGVKYGLMAGIALSAGIRLTLFFHKKIKKELMIRNIIALDAQTLLQQRFETLRRELEAQTHRLETETDELTAAGQKIIRIRELTSSLDSELIENTITRDYFCPILRAIICDPVKMGDGYYFERRAIQRWYDAGNVRCIFNENILMQDPKDIKTNANFQNEIIGLLENLQVSPRANHRL